MSGGFSPGSLKIVRDLTKYNQVRLSGSTDGLRMALTRQMITHTFAYRNQNAYHQLERGCFLCKRTILAMNSVDTID
jgi:hypothetical protein